MVRLRVKVELGGEVFRTSLFADARRGGHFLLVNKKMQKAAGAGLGAEVDFAIEPDLDERTPEVPPELAKVLKTEKKLARWYEGLSESMRWEIGKWIDGVKGAEARERRAEQMAERLMLTMEGEKGAAAGAGGRISESSCRAQRMGGDDEGSAAFESAGGLLLSKPRGSREASEEGR